MRSNLLRGAILAVTLLIIVAPVSAAAPSRHGPDVASTVTVEAINLDCDFRGEPDCLNLVTRVDWNGLTGTGTLCVDVGDFGAVHPPVARGCAKLTAGSVTTDVDRFLVSSTSVPAVYTEDCYNTDPEEQCVPRSIELTASLVATLTAPSAWTKTQARTGSRECRTIVRTRTQVGNADIVLTVDDFEYRLPDSAAGPHTASSTLSVSSTRTTTSC